MVLAADPRAESTGTGEHPLNHQVQMNETIPSASSGNIEGATINVVATVVTPADNEEQVQVVIEAPPSSSGHSTDAQNAMADVLIATYCMLADYVFSTFASGTFW
jgi:predicted secreted protein